LLFIFLALAIPIVLIGVVELGLRLAGYGGFGTTYHIAATGPDGRTLIAADNQRVDTFFFNNRDLPGQLNPTHFWNPKGEDTLRVIVVGESAIKGFPQPASLTAPSFLGEMLRDALPERTVEVINLGTTAIASFAILELGTEALEQDPDVLIVQAGNNEFFGAFGVASLNRAGNSPGAIALQRWGKSLALVQWADETLAKLRGPAKPEAASNATLMERMMGRSYTPHDDPSRGHAARNIGAHLRTLAQRCAQRGVPMVVCLTGVNERGMAPLGESRAEGLSLEDKARFDALMSLPPEACADRIDDLRWAVGIAPTHARAHWLLGTAHHALGDFAGARDAFQNAVDLDTMPWRATGPVLAAARASLDGTDAVIADAIGSLRTASEGGTIGWEMMVDHVHMSVEGQEVVARAMFDALTRVPSIGVPVDAASRLADRATIMGRVGANEFEAHGVAFRMHRLLSVDFFRRTNPWAAQIMADRMHALEAGMTDSERHALAGWQDPRNSLDFAVPASAFIGQVCMAEQRYDQGERVYRAAARIIQPFTHLSLEYTYRWLGCRARVQGGLDAADTRIAQEALNRGLVMLSAADTSAPPIQRYVGSLKALLGDCVGAVPHLQEAKYGYRDMELVQVDAQIVECLVKMGRLGDARQIVEYGASRAGPFAPLYRQMEQMLRVPGDSGG
jgi:lysophospholipase L1-like esterase